MPCRSDYMDPTPTEHATTNKFNKDAKNLADRVTYANDVLREVILGERDLRLSLNFINAQFDAELAALVKRSQKLYVKGDNGLMVHVTELVQTYKWLNGQVKAVPEPTQAVLVEVNKQQEQHRRADLARLMVTFATAGDTVRLRKVIDADPTQPLGPQLGFDADDF